MLTPFFFFVFCQQFSLFLTDKNAMLIFGD